MGQEHWETYYRGGALASCPMGLEPGYTREVRDAWVEFFGALPAGTRVVDVGTGNGAVALIAVEVARAAGRALEVHGVDLARIDPKRHVPDGARLLEGITFHPGVSIDAMPFETGSAGAVCGQYAIEYTDVPRTLAEVARVLGPGGRCQFIVHHADSVIVANARESLEHARFVLDESRILRRFRRFLEFEREAPHKARAALQDLFRAGAELRERAATAKTSLTLAVVRDSLERLFAGRQSLSYAQRLGLLDEVERELRTSVHRLRDLVDAARTEGGMAEMAAAAEAAGLVSSACVPQLHGGGNLVGWRLAFTRA